MAIGLLESVNTPEDLRALDHAQLTRLAGEIRDFLVQAVSRTGGHLGPNLGAVELTIALHRVFDSPSEPILFDTGHQAYVHKILTGRRDGFAMLRQRGGLSGYPSRAESEHDWIENSHASTALSYADGLAKALALRGERRTVVAVVGDGALTGGMCWEALNNIAAAKDRSIVIVVNDNGRSYAPTIGGLAAHLNALRTNPNYEKVLARVKDVLSRTPLVGEALYDTLHGIKKGLKDVLTPQGLFEDLGLKYLGPIDGHDIGAMEHAFLQAKRFGGPVIVHCVTRKGYGYAPAERDEVDHLHGPGAFDPRTGKEMPKPRSWTAVFSEEIVRIGADRPDVVALTAAMLHPVGLAEFAAAYPDRVFDVGIAEQHAVTSAAGMAMGGLHPVVCVYSTFLNRAFDQVLMDVGLHGLPVTFVLDRAGITGDDGPSHNGMWDLAILSLVPGMRIALPRDARRLRELLHEVLAVSDGPTAIRFPKGELPADVEAVDRIGGVDVLRQADDAEVLLVGYGPMSHVALEVADRLAAHGISATVVDPRYLLPMDPALLTLCAAYALVVTIEDNCRQGGAGATLSLALRDKGVDTPVRIHAIPQRYLAHGKRAQVLADIGLSAQDIARSVVETVASLGSLDRQPVID
ncbi:1-deoxy-D-xylulose-5-phosphate synthase [Acidothermus cellulolyticus 11B]|uniref:1-deoxy-D-xylulose-5-phosphate synthase n=1 Tax=Acidothermus cellulolyticus (strain ATCC 43068 / DSM 8971 / 11B) TaxID=351607 RepID=A0LUQ5_ACIC1|nr:1-deoxy-D-xylulose-5-phosphate synthase [Acidothermus cellulolyticus]ABK53165.1 1-deoxy-D-xylulose-5-phosphate synthase [Acidothermus cellulolyticus 11B]